MQAVKDKQINMMSASHDWPWRVHSHQHPKLLAVTTADSLQLCGSWHRPDVHCCRMPLTEHTLHRLSSSRLRTTQG